MAYYSIVEFPGDGITTEWDFNFLGGYIDQTHVKADVIVGGQVQGSPTPVFITESRVQIIPPVPSFGTLRLYRETPRAPMVDFSGGTAVTPDTLNLVARQGVLLAAEALDCCALKSAAASPAPPPYYLP